jgi:Tat protein secretion system quality control protein TatD with DNase activity
MAMEIINEGGYIGLSSAILNKLEAVHWVREIPLNKVLLETDDLSISIQEVYRQFANVVDVELEELKWKLYQNTMSLGINWNKNEGC